MDPIQRQRYAEAFVAQGSRIDLAHISDDLGGILEGAQLEPQALDSIAGDDHVIGTEAEFRALLDRIDAQGNVGVAQRDRTIEAIGAQLGVPLQRSAPPPIASIESGGARSVTGLRTFQPRVIDADGDQLATRSAAATGPQYAANELPSVRDSAAPPERSNWFVAIFEFLFQWVPGVDTHTERLEQFGEGIANRHQAELSALERGIGDRMGESAAEDPLSRGVTASDVRDELRSQLVDQLSVRFIADAATHGETLSPADARDRAGTAVDAMLAQYDRNKAAAGARSGELGIGGPPANSTPAQVANYDRLATSLAEQAIPARALATRLGEPYAGLYTSAMALPPLTHPTVAVQPDANRRALAQVAIRQQNVETLESAMALKASGQISHVPDSAIVGIVQAQQRGQISPAAVPRALSALEHLPEAERQRVLSAVDALPADKRGAAYAMIGREQYGLSSSDANERQGAVRRIENTATQLATMSPGDAAAALRRGTLGLDGPVQLRVTSGTGASRRNFDVPVYFHPSVTQEQRDRYLGMLREAYTNIPPRMMDRIVRAEGDEAFNVQIYGGASLDTGRIGQDRPDAGNPAGGYFQPEDNDIRLNASLFDQMRTVHGEADGRRRIEIMMIHETVHYLDDLGNADQNKGLFVNRFPDLSAERARIQGNGDLAPAWEHFRASRDRFEEVRGEVRPGGTDDATVAYSLRNSRLPADERRVAEANDRLAARSGAVSGYSVLANPSGAPNNSLAEWWAETYANYLDPTSRDRLKSVDPVAHLAAQRYTEAIGRGVAPDAALTDALRYSLSTKVSGNQGAEILRAAPATGPISNARLGDLEAIGRAYADHAQALDGWQANGNDAGLKSLRGGEAAAGARSGRVMLGEIATRKAALEGRGQTNTDEYRRLTTLEGNLTRSVTALEARARELSPPARAR